MSLLFTGVGLFAVLTKYNVPELNASYWGENPFLIKRDTIENTMTWIFTCLTLFGLVLQVCGEIFEESIPKVRLYKTSDYLVIFFSGVLTMIFIVNMLSIAGYSASKKSWLPQIIKSQREVYLSAKFIIEHDGLREDQINAVKNIADKKRYQEINFSTTRLTVEQIEKLLELKPLENDLIQRLHEIEPYFEQSHP